MEVTSTLSRRERERLRRRQAILQAACAVFAERGYENATLDEIAERAEFGKGTLYNYFEGGKENILFAIFDQLFDEFRTLIQEAFAPEAAAGRPFRDVFSAFASACFKFFKEREDLFMVMIKDSQQMIFSDDAEKAAYFVQQQERLMETLAEPFEQAMRAGEIRALPAPAVAHMVLGNIKGFQMHRCMQDRKPPCRESAIKAPEEAAAFLTTMIFDGLTRRQASDPAAASH